MPRRTVFLLVLLLAHPAPSRAADEISVTIRQFALGGAYSFGSDPVWLQVSVKNTSHSLESFELEIEQLNLLADASPMADTIHSPQTLEPGETRTLDFSLNLARGGPHHSVIFLQAVGNDGRILGRTARAFGDATEGRVIVLLCGTPATCSAIQRAILLTGSPAEQTRKSREYRIIQLTDPPSAGWAYARASTVVLAAPASSISPAQRDALELFMLRGGNLIVIEDLLAEPPGSTPFLPLYRQRFAADRQAHVPRGTFLKIRSTSIAKLSDFLTASQVSEISETEPLEGQPPVRVRYQGLLNFNPPELPRWFMMRAGTSFRFPSFFTLLFCILAYIAITGIVNFVVLRRLGRPELGWISIPGLALLFSLLLYFIAVRTHPSNYGLDQMTIYQMTDLSPLATSSALVRVSSPSRSALRLSVPATVTQSGPGFAIDSGPQLRFSSNRFTHSEIELGDKRQIPFLLRRWSFRNFDFQDQHRFAGTIYRDSAGRLHNETGVNIRQALVADQDDIFLLSSFPAGAVVDLAHVPHVPYESATGRVGQPYPAPPFSYDQLHYNPPAPSAEDRARFAREYAALMGQPLSATELVRGWPSLGKSTFSETKAVFLGLADSPSIAATLPGRTPTEKSVSLLIVTFGVWP